jgi:hypothetical protein
MTPNDPISLAAAGSRLVIDCTPGDQYAIAIDISGDHIAVCFGQDARKPAARFAHANLAYAHPRVHEFKHYRANGSKHWTSRPGVNLWFVFPKSAVLLKRDKGYSYVKAMIAGVDVTFNVSGGGGAEGWTDYLHDSEHVGVGHSIANLRAVAAVAVRGTDLERQLQSKLQEKPLEPDAHTRFNAAVAAAAVPPVLVQKYRPGDTGIRMHAASDYTSDGVGEGTLDSISFRPVLSGDSTCVRNFQVRFECGLRTVKRSQVDWFKTAQLNGISCPGVLL